VEVSHSNYDTHNENFNFHLEQLGEIDRPFSTFVSDLAERGMLESTLIVVLSEFGRTPNINHLVGRDHWGTAWSVLLGGAKVHPGAIIGKTNEKQHPGHRPRSRSRPPVPYLSAGGGRRFEQIVRHRRREIP
jgi:uncharacterized protein (DUF1501 family)